MARPDLDPSHFAPDGWQTHEHGLSFIADKAVGYRAPRSQRLAGWSIPAKDLYDVAGMPTSLGNRSRIYEATSTDDFVHALLDQGAVIPAKTATSELGLRLDTEPVGDWAPTNPQWPGATPGGSSGGAAVAVARRISRAAHASDGGGSIRVPAAACGLVGFKPSASRGPGHPAGSLAVPGFITTTVTDSAFLHGHELNARLPALRIGLLLDPLLAPVKVDDPQCEATVLSAEALSAAGHQIIPISAYPAERSLAAFRTLFSAGMAGISAKAGSYPAWAAELGSQHSDSQIAAARSHARGLRRLLLDYWRVDAILSPCLAHDPPPLGSFARLPHADNFDAQTRWSPWCSIFNLTGTPAISLPKALPARPPAGVHLGSLRLSDATLLSLAHQLHP